MDIAYSRDLPEPIKLKLDAVAAKMRAVNLARGAAIAVSVFVIAMAAVFILDRFLILSDLHRRLLLLGSLAATATAAGLYLVAPLFRRPADDLLAFAVEAAHPELRESLASTVEILESADAADLKGSPELIAALVRQTVDDTRQMDFRGVVSANAAKRAMCVAGAFLAAVGLYAVFQYNDFSQLFQRFFLVNVPRLTHTRLEVGPGNDTILSGSSITIYAKATGKVPTSAHVVYQPNTGVHDKLEMLAADAGMFIITMGNQRTPFTYRVRAGDAISEEYRVEVVPRPEVTSLHISCEYPKHAGLQPTVIDSAEGAISELVGTKITLKATSSQPLERASVVFHSDKDNPRTMEVAESEAALSFTITANDVYSIKLLSKKGFENLPVPEYPIEALPDLRPAVRIARPGRNLSLPQAAVIDLEAAARDDYALTRIQLEYKLNKAKARIINLAKPQPGTKSIAVRYRWDLTALALKAGDEIAYVVCAFDARGEQGRGESSEFRIVIGLADVTPARKEQIKGLDTARKEVRGLVEKMQANAKSIDRLKQLARNEQIDWTKEDQNALGEAVRKLDDIRKAAAEAVEQVAQALKQAGEKMLAKDLLASKRALERIAAEKLEETERFLEEAAAGDAPGEAIDEAARAEQAAAARSDSIARAEQAQQTAADAVEKIADQLDAVTATEKMKDIRQAASNVATAQQQLEQRLRDQPDVPNAVARNQEYIAQAIGQIKEDALELMEEVKRDQPQAAEQLRQVQDQLGAAQDSAQQAAQAAEAQRQPEAVRQVDQTEQSLSDARGTMRQAQEELAEVQRRANADVAGLQPDIPAQARALAQRQQEAMRGPEQPQPTEPADARVEEQGQIASDARQLAKLARDVADEMAAAPEPDFRAVQDFAEAARALEAFAEQPALEAQQLLEEGPRDPAARPQALAKQAEAATNLMNIADNLERLEAEHELHEAAREADDLAQRQKQLAQQTLRTPAEDLAAVDDVADRQHALEQRAGDLAEALDEAGNAWQDQPDLRDALEQAAQQAA
ncbi:MAG: hypothetical protein HQ592_07765, partial [Planctomycetes bacterium]|nr:hypothetical protein [Planctomycetota bacterium]